MSAAVPAAPKAAVPAVPPAKRLRTKVTWGPVAAVVGTVSLYFGSQVVGSIVVIGIAALLGFSGEQMTEWFEQTGPHFFYIVLIEALLLGGLWWFLRHRKAGFYTLGLIRPKWRDLGYSLIGFAIYFPVLLLTTLAVRVWFPGINLDQPQQTGFESAHGFWPLALVFLALVVLVPLTEEILSRGFLYLGLKSRLPRYAAVILTSLIFAAAHLQFGSNAPLLWSAAIDTFILSLALIYVREATGALWASIGLHMIKNGIAFAVLFIFVT